MYLFIKTVHQEEQQSLDKSLVLPLIASGILQVVMRKTATPASLLKMLLKNTRIGTISSLKIQLK